MPVEQERAEFLLQPANTAGDVTLHGVQRLCRAAHSAQARNCLECFQVCCVHICLVWPALRTQSYQIGWSLLKRTCRGEGDHNVLRALSPRQRATLETRRYD